MPVLFDRVAVRLYDMVVGSLGLERKSTRNSSMALAYHVLGNGK